MTPSAPNWQKELLRSLLSLVSAAAFHAACQSPHQPAHQDAVVHQERNPGINLIVNFVPKLSGPALLVLEAAQQYSRISRLLARGRTGTDGVSDRDWELLGMVLMLAGALVRLLCYRTLGAYFTFKLAVHRNHKLITRGPYAVVRHPSYAGTLIMATGFFLRAFAPDTVLSRAVPVSLRSAWGLSTAMAYFLFTFVKRIAAEEDMLSKEFGDEWTRYAGKVCRLLPFIW